MDNQEIFFRCKQIALKSVFWQSSYHRNKGKRQPNRVSLFFCAVTDLETPSIWSLNG